MLEQSSLPNQVPTAENPVGAAPAATFEATEYGLSRDPSTDVRYGWLGEELRSRDAVGGIMLMGRASTIRPTERS